MIKIRSFDCQTIGNSCSIRINSRKNNGDYYADDKKFKEKLIIFKSRNQIKSKKIAKNNFIRIRPSFFTSVARKVFKKLRFVFNKALIFYYFNLKYYIQVKTNVLGYTIRSVLSQLNYGINFNIIAFKIDLSQ